MNILIISNEELYIESLATILKTINNENNIELCLDDISKYDLHIYDSIIIDSNIYNQKVKIDDLLLKMNENCKVVFLANRINEEAINYCENKNMSGYMLKTYTHAQIVNILNLIMSGAKYFPPIEIHHDNFHITKKELEILKYIKSGLSNKQIAYEMDISECTVKVHVSHIFKKFKCFNRVQLINKSNELSIQ
jgi:DNA-binding NarL/FixJ family response regulator